MLKAECPQCAADLTYANKASIYAVCPYCNVASLREDLNLRTLGAVAELQDDGTPIQIGATGKHRGNAFLVLGRRQMAYELGFWNEWFLEFSAGSAGWLGEAMGLYSVFREIAAPAALPAFNDARIGGTVELDGRTWWIKNILRSECVGAEGELPFAVACPYPCPTIDLLSEGGRAATIDYGAASPRVFVGEYQPFTALEFKNLRELEGW